MHITTVLYTSSNAPKLKATENENFGIKNATAVVVSNSKWWFLHHLDKTDIYYPMFNLTIKRNMQNFILL